MFTPFNHLIIVCCHGIWTGGPSRGFDESEWLIAGFQSGEAPTFIEHIKAGLRELKNDDRSLLMFSGYVIVTSIINNTHLAGITLLPVPWKLYTSIA